MFDAPTFWLSALLLAGGAAISAYGAFVLRRAAASVHWPSTYGQIVDVNLGTYTGYRFDMNTIAVFEYEYEVAGQVYTSRGSAVESLGASWHDDAEHPVADYHVGQQLRVSFNPADPADAILEPGVNPGSYALLVIGALITLFGAWGLFNLK